MKKKIIKPIRKTEIKNKDLLEIKKKDYISLFNKPTNFQYDSINYWFFSDYRNYKRKYKLRRIFLENCAPLKYKSRFNKTYPKNFLSKSEYQVYKDAKTIQEREEFLKLIKFDNWVFSRDVDNIYIPFLIKLIRKCNFNSHKKPKDVLSKSEYQLYKEYTKYVSENRGYIWIDQYKLKKIYNKLTEDQKIIFNRLTKLKDTEGHRHRRSWNFEEILNGVDDVKQTLTVYNLHDFVSKFGFKEELKKILGVDDIVPTRENFFSTSELDAMIQVLNESPRLFKIKNTYNNDSSLESGPFDIVELGMTDYLSSFLSSLKISKKECLYLFGGFTSERLNFRKENYSDMISEIKHVENKYSKLLEEDPKKAFKKLYNYHFISYGSNNNPITGISLKPPGYPSYISYNTYLNNYTKLGEKEDTEAREARISKRILNQLITKDKNDNSIILNIAISVNKNITRAKQNELRLFLESLINKKLSKSTYNEVLKTSKNRYHESDFIKKLSFSIKKDLKPIYPINDVEIETLGKEWQHYQSKFLVRLSKNMYKKILKYAKKYPKDKYAKFFISGITQSKYGYRVNRPSKYLEFYRKSRHIPQNKELEINLHSNSIPRKL